MDRGAEVNSAARRRRLAIACVLSALVLVVLDAAIVNVALPAIALALHVSAAESVLVVTAYQLALVIGLLPSAALGERLGPRGVYALGVALFTSASVACTFAPSLTWLVLARFVQGLGGAAVMSLGVALLRHILPPGELGTAIGWNALAVALASAAGPSVGALVLSATSWRWLFAVNLPLGAVVLLCTRWLPRVAGSERRLDPVSLALHAATFAALLLGAESLPTRAELTAASIGVGVVSAWALVRREFPRATPLVPFDLLRARPFRLSVVASVCMFVGQSAAMVSLPFYLQRELAQTALRTGLLITPWPLAVALVAPWGGRRADRDASAWPCVLGAALLALGLSAAALWPVRDQPLALVPILALCGTGFGLFQVANNRTMLLSAPTQRSGAAGGMQGTARLTGQALGGVLMTYLFTVTPHALAPRLGLAIGAATTLVAAFVSRLRDPLFGGRAHG